MITKPDVARLLAMAAAYDQRTVGRPDVDAWHLVAIAGRWTSAHAARALIEHYSTETDRIMPAHITRRLKAQRDHFASTYRHKPAPQGVRGEQAEVEWEREQLAQHITACMDMWAAGERAA